MEKVLQQRPFAGHRIVLYGPESTGKTTLAKALAAHYDTRWVPEFARDYLQTKWDQKKEICTLEDLHIIVKGQLELENQHSAYAQRFLFCDTNVVVTQLWSQTHFDCYCAPEILDWATTFHYAFYLLTDIDVPWEKDDLRDRPDQRTDMFRAFEQELQDRQVPYHKLSGPHADRLKTAIALLEKNFPLT